MTSLTIPHIERSKMPELYGPGANWRDSKGYPAIKPSYEYTSADFYRLAWEILRRTPRYRWHFKRIKESGLLESRSFKADHYFFSGYDGKFFRVPGWESICLDFHNCAPSAKPGQLLGDYVNQHQGQPWLVVHGPRWALNLWGLSEFVDPSSAYQESVTRQMFVASIPCVVEPLVEVSGSPGPIRAMVAPQEVYIKFRLDSPVAEQAEMAARLLDNAQRAGKRQNMMFGVSVRLKQLELASIWLRCWDAVQEIGGSGGAARFDRKDFVRRLEADVSRLPKSVRCGPVNLVKHRRTSKTKLMPDAVSDTELHGGESPKRFGDVLAEALSVDRVDKWLARAKKYIEQDHDFYRRVLAKAFVA
jgi:hypothetical protein